MKILVLLPEAFGGLGGIALYNRDLLSALCSYDFCSEVVAFPRLAPTELAGLPEKLTYVRNGTNGKLNYLFVVMRYILRKSDFDLIICSHINLLSVAWLAKLLIKPPIILLIYGIDAWQPTRYKLINLLARRVTAFVSISQVTKDRFLEWTKNRSKYGFVLPNAIHIEKYGVLPGNSELVERYDLENCIVLLTLGRLDKYERYKGVDEVLEVLPELLGVVPNLKYIVAGEGTDLKRLQNKVISLGLGDSVIFTGFVADQEKPDLYRLADAYVMAGRGEGFGFVFLEAMACGIPTVASILDGSREAVRDGSLGIIVDPNNRESLKSGILNALKMPKKIPAGLEYFSYQNFVERLESILGKLQLVAK